MQYSGKYARKEEDTEDKERILGKRGLKVENMKNYEKYKLKKGCF